MKTSNIGLNLIKKWEGFRAEAYQDSGGVWTIGYGHTNNAPSGSKYPVYEGKVVTEEQATIQLAEDLVDFEKSANIMFNTNNINQEQFDALISLIYNRGATRVSKIGMPDAVNRQDWNKCIELFKGENFAQSTGEHLVGLDNRRNDEIKVFKTNLPSDYWSYGDVVDTIKVRYGDKALVKFSGTCGIYTKLDFSAKSGSKPFEDGEQQLVTILGWQGKYYKFSFISDNGRTYYGRIRTKK